MSSPIMYFVMLLPVKKGLPVSKRIYVHYGWLD